MTKEELKSALEQLEHDEWVARKEQEKEQRATMFRHMQEESARRQEELTRQKEATEAHKAAKKTAKLERRAKRDELLQDINDKLTKIQEIFAEPVRVEFNKINLTD